MVSGKQSKSSSESGEPPEGMDGKDYIIILIPVSYVEQIFMMFN